MTARLVALMSSLLFLSLLAFILLVRQSEDAVMAEVGKTVSKASLETVRAVMAHGIPNHPADGDKKNAGFIHSIGMRRSFVVRHGGKTSPIATGEWTGESRSSNGADVETAVGEAVFSGEAVDMEVGPPGIFGPAPEFVAEETPNGTRYRITFPQANDEAPIGLTEIVWAPADGAPPTDGMLRRAALCQALLGLDGAGLGLSQIFLPQMPVRVDTEKDGTMQVAIRLVASEGHLGDDEAATDSTAIMFLDGLDDSFKAAPAPGGVILDLESEEDGVTERQTVFQMSTRDYGAVFEALRGRMWALFVAVALFGTLLSAGLARRFTRPVRDLDAAIRRLSRDDLDVEVAVRGGGEVGRLTTAFNEMARRLRIARERSRELTRRERLSALGRLAAGVAHDVRNPLHSINLSLQHLQDTCRPKEASAAEFDRTVGIIRGEIRRLDGLVSNFLRFARTGVGERGPIEVDHLVRETGDVVAKEALARGVKVEVVADSQGVEVMAEGDSLRSALLNLVLNSFEAMPNGGKVLLRSRCEDEVVILEVTDDGTGIPAEDREQIFDFGFTSREDGHGLGLAMVHEIVVEEHDGRVSVDSEEGVGTTIRIELPVAAAKSAVASA